LSAPVIVHDPACTGGVHSDAAKRVSDQYRLHRVALGPASVGRWLAVALADGTTDGTLYDTKRDAIRHQHHNEQYYAFVCIGPHDMSVCEAEGYMAMVRQLYDAGIRLTDPDHAHGGREVIPRVTREDQWSLVRSIRSKGRARPSGFVYPGE
jgi:hypothetical protein